MVDISPCFRPFSLLETRLWGKELDPPQPTPLPIPFPSFPSFPCEECNVFEPGPVAGPVWPPGPVQPVQPAGPGRVLKHWKNGIIWPQEKAMGE
ncbi:hypothetical protein SLEP1_g22070 [Rubroshorea leprosula]|uniref:Uncharacterized protein n=1 Tax=Rubroshorea leprosula TaxID=152421 RepID=A0AAV5JK33_9ROSI|nr:hypothetical protein SLEP1_g22070 [Rubroshorea leprosula]